MVKKQCIICGNVLEDNRGAKQENFVYSDEQICRDCAFAQLRDQYGN